MTDMKHRQMWGKKLQKARELPVIIDFYFKLWYNTNKLTFKAKIQDLICYPMIKPDLAVLKRTSFKDVSAEKFAKRCGAPDCGVDDTGRFHF